MLRPDFLFQLANQAAAVGWLLLVVAPRWRGTRAAVLSGALPLLLAATYVGLIGYQTFAHPAAGAGFGSLAQVAALFREPWALLAGWVHYCASTSGWGPGKPAMPSGAACRTGP